MEIETLAKALEREHREIDAGIEAGDERSLPGAIQALRRHIYLEEEFLFPLLREAVPALSAPVLVMLREHGQLWQLLDSLEQKPGADGSSGTGLILSRQLTVLLLHHNLKEEKILYPRADLLLTEPAAARLREFIASGQLPQGWTCARAATAR
jgi:hemerythrin-like domain-containing protein